MNTVSIKPITEYDADVVAEILSCPEQTRFLPNERSYSKEQQQTYLRNRLHHWQQHGFGSYIIELNSSPTLKLGFVGAEYSPDPSFIDIRFALAKQHAGKGYMLQACQLLLREFFSQPKQDMLYGAAMKENMASLAVLKKIGMQPDSGLDFYQCDGLRYFSLSRQQYHDSVG
ncbi:hypothetical protein GCM10011297_20630 [Bacterioplanes sanyensis]|uniref:GNAT family N-acetyltransferase n=1 Tax=Bacterioplanes sanyensis TaxID=1249553 RepID=UPI0019A87151|nr:GNAT family N-acetyltransferase [Bacterioplanes sanyensis]GGY47672.1 hypothetical protein GCM10011297_20630 [Bacterioplanes sanyensis]